MSLQVEALRKTFEDRSSSQDGTFVAVDGISLEIEEGQLYTLLGPSGCGKTTTLRMVAGLEDPDDGVITVGGRVLYSRRDRIDVHTHRRGLGMVFQSYAIWPHMTVRRNVEFALRRVRSRKLTRKQIRDEAERALDLVGLGDYGDRPATKLSGGQQQRLALARALAVEPPVLLLDEPLSNLDQKLRERMRLELKRMQRDLGITTLYVTHDQLEAMALSNTIAVMNAGRFEQVGRPADVYNLPHTHFVADFIGSMNFIPATVRETAPDDTVVVDTVLGAFVASAVGRGYMPGAEVHLSIRPENVTILPAETDVTTIEGNAFRAKVERREFQGESAELWFESGGIALRVRTRASRPLRAGDEAVLRLPPQLSAVIAIDAG